ncbi:hypothetical protein BESB_011370 [Besnoitia besnoiti]|uniref:Uncharacterized protein n=1 Tax=Besnoitia besnoiti TaxID=94643 RepID=A0A2A9ML96_BESBE|nr:hypothetical protein BESB_011370 [Besnoitia besnoiti]PFH38795.1 hypothetical protein BESB_011370 [Besnoitia besnoiti]
MGAPSLSSTGAAAAVARGLRQRKRGAQQPSSRSFASQSARRQPAPQSPSARSVGEADSSFSPSALFRAAASAFPPSSPPPSSAASPPVSSQSPPSLSGLPPPLGASWRAVALAQETARRPLSPVGAFPQPASASCASSSFPSLPPPGGYPSSPSPPYSSSSPSLPRPPGASPPSLTRAQQPPPSSLPHGAAHRPPLPPRRLLQGVRPRAAPGSALPQGLPCPAGVLQAASGAFSAPSFLSPPHPSFAPSPPWKGSPSGKLDDGLAHVSLPANPTFEDRLFFSLLPLVQGVECPAAGPPAGDKARTARPRPRASDRGRSPSPAAGQQPDAQAKEALELLQTKRTLLLQLYAIIYGEAASPQRGSASVASAYLRPAPAQAAQLARSPLSAAVLSNTLPDFRRLASASTWTPKALRALTEKYGSLADLAQTPRRDNSPSPQVWLALFYTLQRMGPKDSYDRLFLFFLRALLPSFPHFFEAPPSSAFAAAEETPAERVGEGARQKEEAAQARRVAGGQTRARSGRDYEPLFLRFDPETLLPLTEALARARLPYASLFCLQGGLSLYGAQLVKTEADAQLALRILRGIALSLADQIKFPRQAPLRAQKLPSAPGSPTSSGSPTPPAPPSSPAPSQETFAGAAAPWKSPRTVDEPHTEGGYGRASYAVLAAWQQLWLLYQRLPDVAPASKISFFLQASLASETGRVYSVEWI